MEYWRPETGDRISLSLLDFRLLRSTAEPRNEGKAVQNEGVL